MYMAKVIGSVVSTQKDPSLVGRKLMIVQPVNSDGQAVRHQEVAADSVGAGVGEYVLLVRGAGARRANRNEEATRDVNDCSIVGIIDRFDK
ncbi:EutN/CcmL family microcompartment protein [Levilactobacillus brevis]|jgi:carbon dioxide concentrating mechanism protein CcmL|uniref:Propanediol utilization protein n=3 Tax=Levilactobacillus brevis TaxID=1580 RepID=Q03Q39_LEVBA|nr:EutN/CcmL family microcompartment protein [Levilactobacillus brevis]MBL3536252.1 EutN/CcmL family microcompartment protein [Lactobacillus sp. GPR40-2]MBL3629607.1 EutN/CcmL family microcompartment protein [Lactobacillus sp. GPB7-4]ABJ64683.1 Propanediol utilization protein [Levilactobacillus brevis ATCC 367]ANN49485.1 ethanolamine utilization protein EutN [Levilactobacillus brevis]ARN93007.1 ethanolamine utilization protein EutN [Levilactobacillus brevis]